MAILSLDEIKSNSSLKGLFEKYKISDEILMENQILLSRFLKDVVFCEKEEPLKFCKQIMSGVQQTLVFKNNIFYIASKNCKHWIYENKDYKILKNILHADYDLQEDTQSLGEYIDSLDEKNMPIDLKLLFTKIKENLNNKNWKGIYLYGSVGIGKTFLMKKLANTYAKKDKQVIFVTVNKFIKIIKDSFNQQDKTSNSKFFDDCLKVDVLILDDIGAEIVSDWSRDELLFGILNHRLENKMTTYFTSNFSIDELQKYYLNKRVTNVEEKKFEKQKNLRFTERIKGLTFEIELKGKNKRY